MATSSSVFISPPPPRAPECCIIRRCLLHTPFSFGDSTTDIGNFVSAPPSGETFFGQASGCFSDGRLIVDFGGICFSFL
jgi:hypothetical protein